MTWEDNNKNVRDRSAISRGLHYQKYVERHREQNEEKRHRLARVCDRYVFGPCGH